MSLADLIIGNESGGNAYAQNPNSSAGGLGQFIDSTWLSMLQKHRPDLVEGKSPQELLALKSDPALSREMTDAYAADNQAILSKNGAPVTPGSTYLAHFAGPQGAVSVLNSDPNAPVSAILGDAAVKANPFLRGMTAGDLRAWADRKMGGGNEAPQAAQPTQVASAAPATPAAGIPIAPQAQSAPIFPKNPPVAPQQAGAAPSYFGQMPADGQPPPFNLLMPPPRRPIDLSRLQAALQASGNRGLFLSRG